MEVEQGIVEKASNRKAWVRIEQSSSCATCESRETCGVTSNKRMIVEVANDLQAKIGDRVEISMPESSLLKLSFLVYFLPILALMGGAILGARLAPFLNLSPTAASVIGGALAMATIYCVLRWLDRGSKTRDKFYPRMTRILFSAKPPFLPGDSR